MLISNRMHKALAKIALALIVVLLVEAVIAHRPSTQLAVAVTNVIAASQDSQYRDPYDGGGYLAASGRLLWQRTHQLAASVYPSSAPIRHTISESRT
jgi:hypothetical protein